MNIFKTYLGNTYTARSSRVFCEQSEQNVSRDAHYSYKKITRIHCLFFIIFASIIIAAPAFAMDYNESVVPYAARTLTAACAKTKTIKPFLLGYGAITTGVIAGACAYKCVQQMYDLANDTNKEAEKLIGRKMVVRMSCANIAGHGAAAVGFGYLSYRLARAALQ